MTFEQAVQLREKFYAGTTSVQEERALRAYLFSEACPPDWRADREVMLALTAATITDVPSGLEERIATRLWQAAPKRRSLWRRFGAVASIAATLTALFVGLHLNDRNNASIYVDTCITAQQAANETHNTLYFVSEQLNLGMGDSDELGGPCP